MCWFNTCKHCVVSKLGQIYLLKHFSFICVNITKSSFKNYSKLLLFKVTQDLLLVSKYTLINLSSNLLYLTFSGNHSVLNFYDFNSWILQVIEFMWYLSFYAWLISLYKIIPSSTNVVTNNRICYF